MARRIQILPPSVVGKIAAGEVVERPASVVKELVENAIDASCAHVRVEISGGGETLIRVSDDGHGMAPEDAQLAFERHATSKIVSAQDLEAIQTLGFRGEALSSIAAVSSLELSTRDGDHAVGTEIRLDGGVLREKAEVGRPVGTSITVKKLFFNIPARRKFLRSPQTEFRRIVDTVTHLALAHRNIAFELLHNGRQTLNLPQSPDLKNRLADLWPLEQVDDLLFFSNAGAHVDIEGGLGTPKTSRRNRHQQIFILNGRPVLDKILSHALFQAYQGYFPKERHPVAVIIITIDPGLVDVNVHPAKREVRFREGRVIHDLVAFTVGKALNTLTPQKEWKDQLTERTSRSSKLESRESSISYDDGSPAGIPSQGSLFVQQTAAFPSESLHKAQIQGELVSLWQLHNLYIFSAIKSGVVIIDQHAAHERILYERAKKNFRESSPSSQQLLFPQVLELTQGELQTFDEHQDLISKLGFSARPFGGRTVLVEAEPAVLKVGNRGQTLRDILDDLATHQPAELDREERLARAFACKGAVKAGDVLNQEEMNSLVNMLFATSSPYTCPHGRPTIIRMSLDELARKFGR